MVTKLKRGRKTGTFGPIHRDSEMQFKVSRDEREVLKGFFQSPIARSMREICLAVATSERFTIGDKTLIELPKGRIKNA